MSRQTVEVPDHVERVVTLGAVPVINSFLFALGEQSVVANGVPPELSRKIHFVFAPGLAAKPIVQGAEKGLAVETIISLQPDLVLTMDRATAESLRSLGLPVAFLQWTAPADVKAVMKFLGQVFYREQEALAYQDWFDKMIGDVTRRIDSQTASPPRVLYLNLKRLTQPHKIAEWWIPRAGGLSVTDNGRAQESFTFSIEQILAWNPQIIIVADMSERQMAFDDPRLKEVAAVRDRRVYVAPAGAHLWANRTVEQPLTVLWAATIFHPAIFGQRELRAEMARFYDRFFHIHLNDERIDEILAGSSGR
ncbi:ABC transporter substrate-binding protein [Methylocystis sp. MJC1]|uniref:ABC transporter substrate-binding protein n=1 Tax=Methylocystis sp. MJC1 TaxID=2654282 RepID=UPI001FEF727A|nr:ABC transporter substrate-binding protein [Methylocystis sp. MJC1]